jgi:hypothetical protein
MSMFGVFGTARSTEWRFKRIPARRSTFPLDVT